MRTLFDELEDETPASTGQEIGEAVSQALAQVASSNQQMVSALTSGMQEAMARQASAANERMVAMMSAAMQEAMARQVVAPEVKPEPPRKWVFDVRRDEKGRMTQVVATAS